MNRITHVLLYCILFLTACQSDPWEETSRRETSGIVFKLQYDGFDDATSRSSNIRLDAKYDRVEFCIVDAQGSTIEGIKSLYDPNSSEIKIEGLQEGSYTLSILGIIGDETRDGATISPIRNLDEVWLRFPSDIQKPLEAEYFYSRTPFTVVRRSDPSGDELISTTNDQIVQKRIIGRTDFSFDFNNPYVETALLTQNVTLESPLFLTEFSGSGQFSGASDGIDFTMDLGTRSSYLLLPSVEETPLSGEIELTTRNYRGFTIRRTYDFTLQEIRPNTIEHIHTQVEHPDDRSATLFITERSLEKAKPNYILQDDEPYSVYTDGSQRSFNTADPLQISISDDGLLHARFYSPRDLSDVLIQARIPSISEEFFDLTYFDRVPAFVDFYGDLPMATKTTVTRTESGKILEMEPVSLSELQDAEFRISSDDPFWKKLEAIEHGWTIGFALYGGDPELPNGGPIGNWMGIRPVHCREVVALFLNFTYMIDMPEHEEILRANADRLYGNGGVNDKVSVETVLRQMRQKRTLNVGLVYPGNGVIGLGGGSVFGAYQQAWFQHYFNSYSCEIMFHELGHVMGYSHSSSFTYGPWAQELMNHFYVDHIQEMPIDSPLYLNSAQNPNKY